MKLLLDTHIFLWFISGSPQLSATFRDTIQNLLTIVTADTAVMAYQMAQFLR